MTDSESQERGIIPFFRKALQRSGERATAKQTDPEVTAKGILNQTRFTEVASYWSGMPASRKYCDEREIRRVYDLIKEKTRTPAAAYSFANMVLDMPSLAPANLVRATLSLAHNNWIYDPDFSKRILAGNTDIRPVRPDTVETIHDAVAEGFFGQIAAASDKKDESTEIRQGFEALLGDDLRSIQAARQIIDAHAKSKEVPNDTPLLSGKNTPK